MAAEAAGESKALAVLAQAQSRFKAMPAQRRTWLLGSGLVLLAVVAAATWYVQRPDWRVLFSGLDGKDAQQVAQELGAAGIPFEMTLDGTGVQVPAESVDKARMEVAAKGMPQSGRLGFELFDKPNWVGSEFDERVNYQRALEGELEHTIGTLGVVRSARVHLVLPQPSLFLSEQKVAKASVVLKLKRSVLDPEQTESIRNLVASAVENLSPTQVTLVDADGRVNLEAKGRSASVGQEGQELEAKLVTMLEPLAGGGNVRATVNVTYEEDSEERTDEVYDPTLMATLSSQKSEQSNGSTRAAQGIPGTASNTPAAAPVGAVQGSAKAAAPGMPPLLQGAGSRDAVPVYPTSGGNGQTIKEESGTFAVTRHVMHSELSPGRVRRVTAAVVVNDRMSMEGTGKSAKAVWKPRSSDEMHRLEQLAQAAIGFDGKRGDQVVVENVTFTSNVADAEPAGAEKAVRQARDLLETQPALLKTVVTGVLGMLLVMFVLKPVARQVVATLQEPLLLPAAAEGGTDGRALRGALYHAAIDGGAEAGLGGEVPVPRREARIMEEVTTHIRREPGHSTRLLEAWIASEGDD